VNYVFLASLNEILKKGGTGKRKKNPQQYSAHLDLANIITIERSTRLVGISREGANKKKCCELN
jgi:hypothetical protein